MSTLNCIDLFSGAGGLSYGFQSAGFNVLLGIDNDAKPKYQYTIKIAKWMPRYKY